MLDRNTIRRVLATGLIAGILAVPAVASALNKDDILNLHNSGLGPDVIVQVIRSSTDPLTVTPDEVEELRSMGVASQVLDEICVRVGCGGAPAGPGPGPGFGPGIGPNLDAERQRQEELERQRQELERQRMEQELEQMRSTIQQEEAAAASVQQAFLALGDAERAQRNGRYVEAAQMYQNFLATSGVQPGANEHYQALSGFVRAMHAAGYRQTIRSDALQAVLYGPNFEHFQEMVGILIDVANDAQYLDPNFEELTGFAIGSFDQDLQDDYNFFLGRFFWIYGEYDRSIEYLGRVSGASDHKPKAHYLSGVMYLEMEDAENRFFREFQNAIIAGEELGGADDIVELAYLALARLSYEIGQYDAALFYYNKVEVTSARHPNSMFERAWTYYEKDDWNRAIGTLHSLHSPYYNSNFWPDLYVIEAATYLKACNLDAAEATLAHFYSRNQPVLDSTRDWAVENVNPDVIWNAITTYYDRLGTPEEIGLPIEAVHYVLQDVEFLNYLQLIEQLELEQEMLGQDQAVLGQYAQDRLQAIQLDLQSKRQAAGLAVGQLLRDFVAELENWDFKAQEVGIEVTSARIGMLNTTLEGGGAGAAGTTVFVLASDWQYWPFEGEYWIDEVDNYRGDLMQLRDQTSGQCMPPPDAFMEDPMAAETE